MLGHADNPALSAAAPSWGLNRKHCCPRSKKSRTHAPRRAHRRATPESPRYPLPRRYAPRARTRTDSPGHATASGWFRCAASASVVMLCTRCSLPPVNKPDTSPPAARSSAEPSLSSWTNNRAVAPPKLWQTRLIFCGAPFRDGTPQSVISGSAE